MLRYFGLIGLGLFLTVGPAYAGCENSGSDQEARVCLEQDLRAADKRINAVYKELMKSLNATGKVSLRDEQRAWLKLRDKACTLDAKESDREKWLSAILVDQQKTACVVRYTYSRVTTLDSLLQQNNPKALSSLPPAPAAPRFTLMTSTTVTLGSGLFFFDDDYGISSTYHHRQGKHYFEVWFDRGKMAQLGDILTSAGFLATGIFAGKSVNVRHSQTEAQPVSLGLALDLDDGFFYYRENGRWINAPGSVGGLPLKPNRDYRILITGSSEIKQLVFRGLVKINLGGQPFAYALPDGYRPFKEP